MPESQNKQPASTLKVAAVVSFYMVSALVMVFVNKAVLNSTPDLPFSFLFIQLIIAVLLLHIVSFLSRVTSLPTVELPKLDARIAWKMLPITGIAVVGLVFNTLCLASVDASFFQIARGLQLPLTILVSSLHAHALPGRGILQAAAIVAFGFFLGVIHPGTYSSVTSKVQLESTAIALLYGFMSSLMIAVHAVMVKPAHAVVDGSVIKLTYWTNLISAVGLIPFILFNNELPPLVARYQLGGAHWHTFVYGSAITGVFGFLLCMAGLLSITNTSATTHMFSSAVRSVLQTVLGKVIFGDIITSNRGASIGVITLGALYFTYIKAAQQKTHKKTESGSASAAPPPYQALKSDEDSQEMIERDITAEFGGSKRREAGGLGDMLSDLEKGQRRSSAPS